jgi:hypothetical protein
MALEVILQDEDGNPIAEALDRTTSSTTPCRTNKTQGTVSSEFIDLFGNTVFNGLQMQLFIEEWRRLYPQAASKEEGEFLATVEALAKQCADTPHSYLKFEGD